MLSSCGESHKNPSLSVRLYRPLAELDTPYPSLFNKRITIITQALVFLRRGTMSPMNLASTLLALLQNGIIGEGKKMKLRRINRIG